MVSQGRGRLFRRKDGKYLIYLPKMLVEDTMFPFNDFQQDKRTKEKNSIHVKISFKVDARKPQLLIEKANGERTNETA